MTKQEQFVEAVRAAISDDLHKALNEIKNSSCPLNAEDRQDVPLLYDVFKNI